MKGILIEPGKEPVVTTLPDTLQGIEHFMDGTCLMRVLPRTPAVLFFLEVSIDCRLNRVYRGQHLYGPILCYGWKNNSIVPLNKALQTELLDRLKDTEVRV